MGRMVLFLLLFLPFFPLIFCVCNFLPFILHFLLSLLIYLFFFYYFFAGFGYHSSRVASFIPPSDRDRLVPRSKSSGGNSSSKGGDHSMGHSFDRQYPTVCPTSKAKKHPRDHHASPGTLNKVESKSWPKSHRRPFVDIWEVRASSKGHERRKSTAPTAQETKSSRRAPSPPERSKKTSIF